MSEDETLHQQLYQSPNQQHQLLQAFYDSLPKQVNPAQLSETGNEDLEKATQFWNHLSSSITLLPPSSTSYHSASYPNNTLFGSSYQDQELIYSSLPSSEANEEDQVLSEALEVRQSVNPLPDWFNYETPDSNDDLFVQSPSGLSSSHLTPTCETEIEIYNDPSEQPLIHQSKNSISKRYSPFVADQPRSATPPPKILLHNHQGPQMTSSIFKYGCNPDQALSLAPSPPRTLFPEQSITQQSELLGVQGSIKRSLERVTSHKHQQQQLREDGRENGEIKFLGYRKCSSNGSVRNQLSSDFSPCSPLRPSQAINHQNHQSTNSHNTRRHQPIYSSDTNLQHCYQNSDEQENLCVSLGGKEDLVDQRRNFNEQNTLRFLKEESVEGEVKFGFKDVDEFRGVSIGLFEGNIGEVVTLKDEEYFKLNF
ncbi:hypothetical protein BY996DRAFT_7232787 [Phakopsora pachyrhizi]|nr:hypothetical protein BY996DRAFT_7232787 [Phakopsora pachyrhizi]